MQKTQWRENDIVVKWSDIQQNEAVKQSKWDCMYQDRIAKLGLSKGADFRKHKLKEELRELSV